MFSHGHAQLLHPSARLMVDDVRAEKKQRDSGGFEAVCMLVLQLTVTSDGGVFCTRVSLAFVCQTGLLICSRYK